jgi:hypothetical protein
MIKGHIDGLQVLKGGQGKATVYFSKDAMHGALDLNGQDVTISRDSCEQASVLPSHKTLLANIEDGLERLLDEVRAMRDPTLIAENYNAGPAIEAARGALPDLEEITE